MDRKLEEILKTVPTATSKSRLEPFRELILRLRRDGHSYNAIRLILEERCDLHISNNALLVFIRRRQRTRTSVGPESPRPGPVCREPIEREEQPKVARRWTQEEIEAMRAKARASAHRPTTEPEPPPVFHYDPNRPLTNRAPDNKETNK
jgi:hypothetical protein